MKGFSMNKKLYLFISLILCLSLLTSCSSAVRAFDYLIDSILGREIIILTPYDKMEYNSPDFNLLEDKINKAENMVNNGEDKRDLLSLLSEITDSYYKNAVTMRNLAYVEYCKDITSKAATDEYYGISSKTSSLLVKLNGLYAKIADSQYKDYLEKNLFGSGYFDSYMGSSSNYDEELLSYISYENELLYKYSSEMSKLSVDYEGETYTSSEISSATDPELYKLLITEYYDKYNTVLGNIFVELVKTRQKISTKVGFSSYAEYAGSRILFRDYKFDDIKPFLNTIKTKLAPIYSDAIKNNDLKNIVSKLPICTTETIEKTVDLIIPNISSDLSKVYSDMKRNGLYSIGNSDSMYYGSYQLYLPKYDSPYMFVNGSGRLDDVLTVIHEFGHFASAYYNHGAVGSNDESEIASQALELLSIKHFSSVLNDEYSKALSDFSKISILASLVECAQYTEFEELVYSDSDITLGKCNDYFMKTCTDYLTESGLQEISAIGKYWVFTNHFFEQPFYMVGYSVSASAAIQIALLEEESSGGGLKTYLDFIKLASKEGTLFDHLEQCDISLFFTDDIPYEDLFINTIR